MNLPWEKIRMAALDLDGTTLRPDASLSDRTREALRACLRCGIEIVIASGRAYATLPDEVLAVRSFGDTDVPGRGPGKKVVRSFGDTDVPGQETGKEAAGGFGDTDVPGKEAAGGFGDTDVSGQESGKEAAGGFGDTDVSGQESGKEAVGGIRYAITSNGAAVNEVPSGKRLWARCIAAEDVERILEAARGEPAALETFVDGVPYAGEEYVRNPEKWGCPSASVGYVKTTRRPMRDIRKFIRDHKDRLDSIDFICRDMRLKERLEEKVLACTEGIYATSSVPHLLEFSAAGGKGAGLQTVCALTGIRPEETAACGNADNDADMLRLSGIGAAVADATPKCLDAADLIIGTNREDGVAAFLEELVRRQQSAKYGTTGLASFPPGRLS